MDADVKMAEDLPGGTNRDGNKDEDDKGGAQEVPVAK